MKRGLSCKQPFRLSGYEPFNCDATLLGWPLRNRLRVDRAVFRFEKSPRESRPRSLTRGWIEDEGGKGKLKSPGGWTERKEKRAPGIVRFWLNQGSAAQRSVRGPWRNEPSSSSVCLSVRSIVAIVSVVFIVSNGIKLRCLTFEKVSCHGTLWTMKIVRCRTFNAIKRKWEALNSQTIPSWKKNEQTMEDWLRKTTWIDRSDTSY